ncbi:hypothetical protein ACFVR1_07045 [Psychrobacillus sp. NPDC058041]|uniref:DUF7662 domain-containing protein n=1 Tax=Psychrobacillus sp. NPDC058041 TaxID=3346310 RepID=UPI0036DB0552
MARGDQYLALKFFLINNGQDEITLDFKDIEEIIQHKLPISASKHAESWWSNNYDHSQAISWMDANYYTDYVTESYKKEIIVFKKNI